ncbi:TrmH family RNA methyltransferase [Gracilimonas mengyeensis]|uniref:RNA methyltransferase, TrmH family n=1 Tax=Gracilimonas mengyeensis TaxID=1302730 RepID=A0A521B562_9BACT|nr:RNA methyltransferase [Gracilimonas mengyeensis]SMO42232.1 RNA methyltransferase, TrmH family [Gracilimonas mengyeensis]
MRKASNNEIKLLRKLGRKKYREKEQRFVVEGERAVEQVIENGLIKIDTVFVGERFKIQGAMFKGVEVCEVDHGTFEEVADTDNPQGILAVCKMPGEITPEELVNQAGVIVATDAIQDPGNMGTILRTAAWFGAKALIAGKGSVDVYHPKVVRSTVGATGSIPVMTGELQNIFEDLESAGWQTLLLDGGADSINLGTVQLTEKTVLVVGNEGNGINPELLNSSRRKVRIESGAGQENVESLNAAVATSIALWKLSVG